MCWRATGLLGVLIPIVWILHRGQQSVFVRTAGHLFRLDLPACRFASALLHATGTPISWRHYIRKTRKERRGIGSWSFKAGSDCQRSVNRCHQHRTGSRHLAFHCSYASSAGYSRSTPRKRTLAGARRGYSLAARRYLGRRSRTKNLFRGPRLGGGHPGDGQGCVGPRQYPQHHAA